MPVCWFMCGAESVSGVSRDLFSSRDASVDFMRSSGEWISPCHVPKALLLHQHELSWPQSSPVLSPPSPAEGLNPQSSIFSVFQSFSVSVLFSPSQSFSVLVQLMQIVSGLKLITNVFGDVLGNASHNIHSKCAL